MFLFENDKCPVCCEDFKAEDDVVVCPECGTPHHRDCYNKTHRCANKKLHKTDFKFERDADKKPEVQEEQQKPEEKQPLPFMPVIENKAEEENVEQLLNEVVQEDEKEEITVDGASVYDVSQVIGSNKKYYLPRFVKKKGLNWNWGAFFFGHLYYFFRKMYLQGFLFLVLNFSASAIISAVYSKQITAFYNVYNAVLQKGRELTQADVAGLFSSAEFNDYIPVLLTLGAVSLGLSVVMGICANRMYRKKVVNIVKTVDEKLKDGDSFAVNTMFMGSDVNLSQADLKKLFLSKQGGITWLAPFLVYGFMMLMSIM